jgi:hypothetical protein
VDIGIEAPNAMAHQRAVPAAPCATDSRLMRVLRRVLGHKPGEFRFNRGMLCARV